MPLEVALAEAYAPWFGAYLGPEENNMEPVSELHYPIVSDENGTTLGLFLVSFYWRHVLNNLLLPGKNGYLVVVKNPCAASFTYRIDGEKAVYKGRGDLHDPAYDYMGLESPIHAVENFKVFEENFQGLPFSHEHCPFSLVTYPSKMLEESFQSNSPIIFALIAGVVVFFSSFVFLAYDWMVQRRQKETQDAKNRSEAIVSSMIP